MVRLSNREANGRVQVFTLAGKIREPAVHGWLTGRPRPIAGQRAAVFVCRRGQSDSYRESKDARRSGKRPFRSARNRSASPDGDRFEGQRLHRRARLRHAAIRLQGCVESEAVKPGRNRRYRGAEYISSSGGRFLHALSAGAAAFAVPGVFAQQGSREPIIGTWLLNTESVHMVAESGAFKSSNGGLS